MCEEQKLGLVNNVSLYLLQLSSVQSACHLSMLETQRLCLIWACDLNLRRICRLENLRYAYAKYQSFVSCLTINTLEI